MCFMIDIKYGVYTFLYIKRLSLLDSSDLYVYFYRVFTDYVHKKFKINS